MALLMDYPKHEEKFKVSEDVEKFVCDALLDEKKPVSERFRALSIRQISGSASRNALIGGMRDDSSLLAYSAAHELGVMQESDAIPALIDVLLDGCLHPIVRHKAAEALGAFGLKGDVGILRNCMDRDRAPEVRETCAVSLARIAMLRNPSSKPASFSIEKLREVLLDEGNAIYERLEALFALRKLVSANEALLAIIESLAAAKSPILRHGVAYVLSQWENKKATYALSNLLQNRSEYPLVRLEAAKALGSIADDHCVMLLKEFATDFDPIVSQSCEVSLKRLDYKRVGKCYELVLIPDHPIGSCNFLVSAEEEKYLCKLLLDKKEPIWMRFRALSVYKLGGPAVRNALVEAMRDASALLACKAAFMLGRMRLMRDYESIPALEAVLSDLSLHPIVRHKAAEALGAFDLESSVPALERSLASDPAPEVRETCVVALGRIMEVKASPLRAALARFCQSALPAACHSIPILREVLLDENRSLYERHSALFQLGSLCKGCKDNLDEVAEAVIESLGATSSTLLRCSVANVLSGLPNQNAEVALSKLLMDPCEHVMVRQEAAKGFGTFSDIDPNYKLLLEGVAARDPEPIVAESCDVALKMLEFDKQNRCFGLADEMHMDNWIAKVDVGGSFSYKMGEEPQLVSC